METLKAKLSAGSVHVYLLDVEGRPVGSQHVATASKVEPLTALLEQTIDRLKVPAGKTIVPPSSQSSSPKADAGALVLHLVARNVERQSGEDVPRKTVLGTTRSGSWGAYPAEDWILLSKAEWSRLVPKGPFPPGAAGNRTGTRRRRYCGTSTRRRRTTTSRRIASTGRN